MLDVEMRDSDQQDLEVIDVTWRIPIAMMAKSMERTFADIAVDSSDEEGEDGQGAKVASQAIVEVEDGGDGEGKRDGGQSRRSCRVAFEEQVS
jgi:hypothetical protein